MVVLPDPVAPTSASVCPASAVNETSRNTQFQSGSEVSSSSAGSFGSRSYANHTFSNAIRPCARPLGQVLRRLIRLGK